MEISRNNINLLRAISVICFLLIIYFTANTILIFATTSSLTINSPDNNSNIVISQSGRQALEVGTGRAHLRLKPGIYQIFAFDNGRQSNTSVTISDGKDRTINLGPLQSVMLPTLSTVNFSGFNQLTAHGMQNIQLSNLEMGLFKFSPFSNPITLVPSSLNFPPFNPSSSSTLSTINFRVLFGTKTYNAVCNYDNLSTSLNLSLYDSSTNNQVFYFSS